MATKFETFKALHTAGNLFILPNAWDAASAIILKESNYPAIGTSSAAVASSLGYADGEEMPFAEYMLIIQRIAASVNVPVTIDMEMGYGKTNEAVYGNIMMLIEAGITGINLEDSIIAQGKRILKTPEEFAQRIAFIKNKLTASGASLFINVRCDTYLLDVKDKTAETASRLKLYESVGADGIFVPFIKDEQDIAVAVSNTKLPLNVMAVPGLPGIDKLNQLGVKRLSMGPFLQIKTYSRAKELATKILDQKSINSII